jgi:hypothetical protein
VQDGILARNAADGADAGVFEPLLQAWLQSRGPTTPGVGEKQPLIRSSVRPSGFEPETCGLRVASQLSIHRRAIHMTCSAAYAVFPICRNLPNTTPLSSNVVAGSGVAAGVP